MKDIDCKTAIIAWVLCFCMFFVFPDVVAQNSKKPRYQPKYHPESDLLNCKKLGVPKIKDAKISKRQQRAWASARARTKSGSASVLTVAPPEDSMSASIDNSTNSLFHTDSSEEVVLSASAPIVFQSTEKEQTLKGSNWFTQEKAQTPDAKFLTFEKDSDPFTDSDHASLQEAIQYTKYGYFLVITQFIPESDLNLGKNTAFERVNRLKSMIANKFKLSPHQIIIKSGTAESSNKGIMVSLLEE
ncbi:MAG: hypothetical protein EAZ57_05570 [Cytophagales bacterium]|nr:MAG: hypothetical protein EAZ67_12855 [Cytophagales bacterium]TAF61011.1 MAG: hypothetical protein EAZ57_05570 [Cytophagales bacterium]